MPPDGLDSLDAKAEQGRRHRKPPPPKRPPVVPVPSGTSDNASEEKPPEVEKPPAEVPSPPKVPVQEKKAAAPKKPPGSPRRGDAEQSRVDPAAVASAVKVAHDHALAYGAIIRRERERLELWLSGVKTARTAGAAPGLLRAGLEAAANRAGIPVEQIPAEVWSAAGLTPPG